MGRALCCCCTCKRVKNVCKSPFRFFIIIATGLNVPPIIAALFISQSSEVTNSCRGPIWLAINAMLSAINTIAAWYICCKITRVHDSENSSIRNFRTARSRAKYMLMKDMWVAIFFTFWLIFIAWLCTGTAWIEQYYCPKFVTDCVTVAVAFGWGFLTLGSFTFIVTMCCAALDDKTYGGVEEPQNNTIPVAHIVEICELSSIAGTRPENNAAFEANTLNSKQLKKSTGRPIAASKAQTSVLPSAPTMSFDL